jgi:malate dehydrogenase (oxaloacetate-decarboxylating)
LARYGFEPARAYDLDIVIERVAPTILVGTTGIAGTFTEPAIREMAARVPEPIVMPLSNPTANAEARPADILAWSDGRAIVATGSPSPPVPVARSLRHIGQANNMFVFPGVGLGIVAARARKVTDRMFLVAAATLSDLVADDRLAAGAIYPPLSQLRSISRSIALAVAREARDAGLTAGVDDVESAVDATMWTPSYAPT